MESPKATSCCMLVWESIMIVVTVVYTFLILYEYNRSGVHDVPTPQPGPVIVESGAAWGDRRLSAGDPCKIDLTYWAETSQIIVNFTAVTALVLILDQFKVLLHFCYRRGNPMYYFASSDHLFNLASAIVMSFACYGLVLPNAIGYIARRISKSFRDCFHVEKVAKISFTRLIDEYGAHVDFNSSTITRQSPEGHDSYLQGVPHDLNNIGEIHMEEYGTGEMNGCESWLDWMWECMVVVVVFFSCASCILMPLTMCHTGPSLAIHSYSVPKVTPNTFFANWWDEDGDWGNQAVVNVIFILACFYLINVVVEFRDGVREKFWCMDFWQDPAKIQMLIIAVQVILMFYGWPIPYALSRLIKPSFVFFGCIDQKRKERQLAYDKLMKHNDLKLAKEEWERTNDGCCRAGAFNKWQC